MRKLVLSLTLAMLLATSGCAHKKTEHSLDLPIFFLDNTLAFQPKRIWRMRVRWDPDLLNESKAVLVKQVQFVVSDEAGRKKLEDEIIARGGETRYLRWIESEISPLLETDRREDAKITRLKEATAVVLNFRSVLPVTRRDRLVVSSVEFPDPIFLGVRDGCGGMNWDTFTAGESVGWEVVLESRSLRPVADRWSRIERNAENFSWQAWSVGQGRQVAYRMVFYIKKEIGRCPLSPAVHAEFKSIFSPQPMRIEW
jgi:hypothetical protein